MLSTMLFAAAALALWYGNLEWKIVAVLVVVIIRIPLLVSIGILWWLLSDILCR